MNVVSIGYLEFDLKKWKIQACITLIQKSNGALLRQDEKEFNMDEMQDAAKWVMDQRNAQIAELAGLESYDGELN